MIPDILVVACTLFRVPYTMQPEVCDGNIFLHSLKQCTIHRDHDHCHCLSSNFKLSVISLDLPSDQNLKFTAEGNFVGEAESCIGCCSQL